MALFQDEPKHNSVEARQIDYSPKEIRCYELIIAKSSIPIVPCTECCFRLIDAKYPLSSQKQRERGKRGKYFLQPYMGNWVLS